MFRSAALAITTTAALTLTACGTTGDPDAVRHVMKDWWGALATGRSDDACDHLSTAGRHDFLSGNAHLHAKSCTDLAGRITGSLSRDARATLAALRVGRVRLAHGGVMAIVYDEDVRVPEGLVVTPNGRPIRLRRINGAWKIEDLG